STVPTSMTSHNQLPKVQYSTPVQTNVNSVPEHQSYSLMSAFADCKNINETQLISRLSSNFNDVTNTATNMYRYPPDNDYCQLYRTPIFNSSQQFQQDFRYCSGILDIQPY
ncbi:unnamed protein product, partial [Didymodactylos carnosus]